MPHHPLVKVEGRITDVFGHRFVVERADGSRMLADLGPEGVKHFDLASGADVALEGEMKPSELKILRIALKGEAAIAIKPHKKPGHHHDHEDASPADAKTAVAKAGIDPVGEPRRKPKHFEVLGRRGKDLIECHVEFDGHIRKEKPVAPSDEKWRDELRRAA